MKNIILSKPLLAKSLSQEELGDIYYAQIQDQVVTAVAEQVACIPYNVTPGTYRIEATWEYYNNSSTYVMITISILDNLPHDWPSTDPYLPYNGCNMTNYVIDSDIRSRFSCDYTFTVDRTANYMVINLSKPFVWDPISFRITSYKITKL